MKTESTVCGWVALAMLFLLAVDLLSVYIIGELYSPKALLDRYPNLTQQEWTELMASPMESVREALMPVWRQNKFILPGLVMLAVGSAISWWRSRPNNTLKPTG